MQKFVVSIVLFVNILIGLCPHTGQAQSSTGLVLIDEEWAQIPLVVKDRSRVHALPTRIDLSSFIPPILHQKTNSTCVGYAVGYYFRSMVSSMYDEIPRRFEPIDLFNRALFRYGFACDQGISLPSAFRILKEEGIAEWQDLRMSSCSQDAMGNPSEFSKIQGFMSLISPKYTAKEKIDALRIGLQNQVPIVLAFNAVPSFRHATNVWKMNSADFKASPNPHALTLVGYDDSLERFLVVNSWGASWGDQGMTWIPYQDLAHLTWYALQGQVTFSLKWDLKTRDSAQVALKKTPEGWKTVSDFQTGHQFQIQWKGNSTGYFSLVGKDEHGVWRLLSATDVAQQNLLPDDRRWFTLDQAKENEIWFLVKSNERLGQVGQILDMERMEKFQSADFWVDRLEISKGL